MTIASVKAASAHAINVLTFTGLSSVGEGQDFIDMLVEHSAEQQKLINPYS